MVYQPELQDVVEQAFRAKCDMCVAGQLRNPVTGDLLRKSTQVLTTSQQMCIMLDFLRCNKDHQHGSIEGSVATHKFGRINLSQYTELYTRQFAHRLARCMLSSAQKSEKHSSPYDLALAGSGTDLALPDTKRRRLEEKQPPTSAYQKLEREQQIAKLVELARNYAPRVGKAWLSDGPVIDMLQDMFPQQSIKGVELCKGADRRRVPPSHVSGDIAPLRLTIGTHRNQVGNFWDDKWETWTGKSRRQLIQKCSPARMLITVFAASSNQNVNLEEPKNNRTLIDEPEAKRHCGPTEDKTVSDKPETENPDSERDPNRFHGPPWPSRLSTLG